MTDHPILFKGDMILAIMTCSQCGTVTLEIECPQCGSKERRKTQTRRIIKNMPETWHRGYGAFGGKNPHGDEEFIIHGDCGEHEIHCRFYPGDLIWPREPFRISQVNVLQNIVHGTYTRDGYDFICDFPDQDIAKYEKWKKPYSGKSSLFMFKSLCRLWLKVKSVRVERVQEISEDDAIREGTKGGGTHPDFWVGAFHDLWDSINAKPRPRYTKGEITHYESYPWEAGHETRKHRGKPWHVVGNPFVFATEFERTEQ